MRIPMKTRGTQGFSLALFGVVVFAALLLMVIGTGAYRDIVDAQNEADARRAVFSYVATRVRAADSASAVSQGEGPQGRSLVLSEDDSGTVFETRIYLYDGSLVEEYAKAGSAYAPADAQKIASIDSFDFAIDGQYVRVYADGEEHGIALRSVQGGSDA